MKTLVEKLPNEQRGVVGSVYIIHFERPYHHAQHYVGWTEGDDVDERMVHHERGVGARLMRTIIGENIPWLVARVFHNADRHFERWVKNQKQTRQFCPHCSKAPRKVNHKRGTHG